MFSIVFGVFFSSIRGFYPTYIKIFFEDLYNNIYDIVFNKRYVWYSIEEIKINKKLRLKYYYLFIIFFI